MTVAYAVLLLRPYLERHKFTARTDHNVLKRILNLAEAAGRLTRWPFRLSEFDFDVVYKAGTKNQNADILSLLETNGVGTTKFEDELPRDEGVNKPTKERRSK